MKRYAQALAGCSPTIMGINRAADIVAALTPPAAGSTALVPTGAPESVTKKLVKFVPGAVGALAGAYFWKSHRWLGLVAGHALINSAYEAYKGDKKKALCYAAVEGAAVLGALNYKKIPVLKVHPVAGFLGGLAAGITATYFVPGSPIKEELWALKAKL